MLSEKNKQMKSREDVTSQHLPRLAFDLNNLKSSPLLATDAIMHIKLIWGHKHIMLKRWTKQNMRRTFVFQPKDYAKCSF